MAFLNSDRRPWDALVSKSTKFHNNSVAKLVRYTPSNLRLFEEIRSKKYRGVLTF